jgi:hypothetical protein
MIFRGLLIALLLSVNAYAKPAYLSSTPKEKTAATQTSSQVTEDDLTKQLTSHGWQITQITKQPGFAFDADHWIFNFSSNGKYKAFGTCNYLSGNFKIDNTGVFRINNLVNSNNHCSDGKDEEIMVFNELLMTDNVELKDGKLLLISNGQGLVELKPTDKLVNMKATAKTQKVKKPEESLVPKKSKGRDQAREKSI